MKEDNMNNKIILYKTEDGRTEIEVSLEGETVWLSQKQMAELFDKDRKTGLPALQLGPARLAKRP